MQLLVGGDCTMIAAPVQCDVDGVSKWSHLSVLRDVISYSVGCFRNDPHPQCQAESLWRLERDDRVGYPDQIRSRSLLAVAPGIWVADLGGANWLHAPRR